MEMNITTLCGTLLVCTSLINVPTEGEMVQSTYDIYNRASNSESQSIMEHMKTEVYEYEQEQIRLEQERIRIEKERQAEQERIRQEQERIKQEEERARLEQERIAEQRRQEELAKQQAQQQAQAFQGVNLQNLLHKSNISTQKMKALLQGTGLYNVAHVFVQAEQQYGVNAIVLASISAQETGWGNSRRAVEDGNLFGYGVYNSSSVGKVYKNGSNTILQAQTNSILDMAKHLRTNYLTQGAKYYHGYSIEAVNVRYCVDPVGEPTWASMVSNIARRLVTKYHNLP